MAGTDPKRRCCINSSGSTIPSFVSRPPRVLSLPHALRFLLATDPDSLTRALRTVYSAIRGFLLKKAGLTRATGHTGAVTLIQRFGSALNLNIHFHVIVLDGVYVPVEGEAPVFRPVPAPAGSRCTPCSTFSRTRA